MRSRSATTGRPASWCCARAARRAAGSRSRPSSVPGHAPGTGRSRSCRPTASPASAGEADDAAGRGRARAERPRSPPRRSPTRRSCERWPASVGALIGLANARYGAGRARRSPRRRCAAPRRCIRTAPPPGTTSRTCWPSAAGTRRRSPRRDRAVALGGPLAEVARATEAEIFAIVTSTAQTDTSRAVALADAPPTR